MSVSTRIPSRPSLESTTETRSNDQPPFSAQANGTTCYDADFTPYRQEIAHTSSCPATYNYKFTGYERDAETGLDYAFARYYSSRLGRFLTTDSLGGGTEDPQSVNRYAYVANNPLNFVDPTGLCGEPDTSWSDSGGAHVNSNPCPQEEMMLNLLLAGLRNQFGGIGGTPGPNNGKSKADIARCAAKFSDDHSMAAALDAATKGKVSQNNSVVNALLGSDASTISNLITGPDRALTLVSPGISQGVVGVVKVVGNLPNPAATGLASMGTATVAETAGGTAFVKSWADATVATSLLGKAAGKAFAVFSIGKAVWDASTYTIGAVRCY